MIQQKKITKDLDKETIMKICLFKDSFWKYGLNSQLKWFSDYVKPNNMHYLIFDKDQLIGYGLIRQPFNYHIIDNILVSKEYRKKGFGKMIVSNLIQNNKNKIYLLCEHKNILFYNKFGFIKNNFIKFKDKDIKDLIVMSLNHDEYIEKYIYYLN